MGFLALLESILLIAFGFALGLLPGVIHHARTMVGHVQSIKEIVEEIRSDAETYLGHGIQSPLYRTPVTYFNRVFEKLMYEGGLKSSELKSLLRLGNQAEQFNRGLDQMHQYIADGGKSTLAQKEHGRIRLKSLALVPQELAVKKAVGNEMDEVETPTRYDGATKSIESLAAVGWFGWVGRYLGHRK